MFKMLFLDWCFFYYYSFISKNLLAGWPFLFKIIFELKFKKKVHEKGVTKKAIELSQNFGKNYSNVPTIFCCSQN